MSFLLDKIKIFDIQINDDHNITEIDGFERDGVSAMLPVFIFSTISPSLGDMLGSHCIFSEHKIESIRILDENPLLSPVTIAVIIPYEDKKHKIKFYNGRGHNIFYMYVL